MNKLKTFPVPYSLNELQNKSTNNITCTEHYNEQIVNQALNLHSKGNIVEAAKYYEYLINQDFTDPRVYSNYGSILKNQGQLKEAELSTRKAIELNPILTEAHLNLGSILKEIGNLKEAEISLRKATQLNPYLANAHSDLGSILNELGNLKEAEISSRKAIELKPNNAVSHIKLARILSDYS